MDWSLGKCISNPHFTDVSQTLQKQFCVGCPIKDNCLQYALDNPEYTAGSVYGGMTSFERQRFIRVLTTVNV